MKCLICSSKNHKVIWNDKIRESAKKFTKNKFKILQCEYCDLVSLKKKYKYLENSALVRSLFNKSNSYKDFINFHKPREEKKLNSIIKVINFKSKNVLESNCGTGIILEKIKKKANITAGLDDKFYKKFFDKSDHIFFEDVLDIIKSKKKFDLILSLSEIEHKFEPIKFLESLKKILAKNGSIVIRVPNFDNIYAHLLGKYFYRYDFRKSHNYYFSHRNFQLLLKKLNLKIVKYFGYNEYPPNHLLKFVKTRKRVYGANSLNFFNTNEEKIINKNIEKSLKSTSLIYIVKKK